jgi:HEAT repeat protein
MDAPKGERSSWNTANTLPGQNDPGSLISDLGSQHKDTIQNACRSLIAMGEPALPPLVEALSSPNEPVRREAGKLLDEMDLDWTPYADNKTLDALVAGLSSRNGFVRMRARGFLVRLGFRAVPSLIQALASQDAITRWEAAKALSKIGDPTATEALIKASVDKNFDVRWLAAEGLISIGEPSLVPLLRELMKNPESERLKEVAHHVLHELNNDKLKPVLGPVLSALETTDTNLQVPLAARSAMEAL